MRIITLGRVAGVGEDDYIYEGNGYLLRFSIESPEQFFKMQLPFIVHTLNIDVRQIMRLELLSNLDSGSNHVTLYISFEDPSSDAERPEDAIEKLYSTSLTLPPDSSELNGDVLREQLVRFFRFASKAVKARFLKEAYRAMQHTDDSTAGTRHETDASGVLYRIHYLARPPSIKEWRNVLLHCAGTLGDAFRLERLDRLAFMAIPNTEDDYRVEVDFVFKRPPRMEKRSKPLERPSRRYKKLFKPRLSRATKTRSSDLVIEGLSTEPLEPTLPLPEKQCLNRFDELDTHERLHFWNKCLSKFY